MSEFVTRRMGLHFPKERWTDLQRGVASAARDLGFEDAETCVRWLLSAAVSRGHIEILASRLTVGETYLFRDKGAFELLEHRVLRDLINSRKQGSKSLRIWSAGCASGEEPYSIAILLDRLIPDMEGWNISVLATDINPDFLRKAAKGEYTEWSFRNVPQWVRAKYFRKTKTGRFALFPLHKEMVTFSYHNLMSDLYPSLTNNTNAMDVILCRNVLMYFSPDVQKKVVGNLRRCLVDGGWLIVSPSELSCVLFSDFTAVSGSGVTIYRKDAVCRVGEQVSGVRDQATAFFPSISDARPQPPELPTADLPTAGLKTPISDRPLAPAPRDPLGEARSLYVQGCYPEAIEKILASPELPGDDAKAMQLLARAFANQGKLAEALLWCEKAVALAKLDPGCHYLLAVALQEQGRTEEAAASLKRALYLDPNFVLAYFALGNLTRKQGKIKESKRYFKNAIDLLKIYDPDDVLAETEGITAGRLMEIIKSAALSEAAA